MNYLIALAQNIEFLDNAGNRGKGAGTIIPFLGFMVFLLGLLIVIVGATKYFTSKHNFNLFFDERDSLVKQGHPEKEPDGSDYHGEKILPKEAKVGKVLMIIGVVFMLLSFVIL